MFKPIRQRITMPARITVYDNYISFPIEGRPKFYKYWSFGRFLEHFSSLPSSLRLSILSQRIDLHFIFNRLTFVNNVAYQHYCVSQIDCQQYRLRESGLHWVPWNLNPHPFDKIIKSFHLSTKTFWKLNRSRNYQFVWKLKFDSHCNGTQNLRKVKLFTNEGNNYPNLDPHRSPKNSIRLSYTP